jgi:transcriptional regulator with XRE-family HTH domain
MSVAEKYKRVPLGPVDDQIGARITKRREELEISQRELSFPGCGFAYISRIESGDRRPTMQIVLELAKRLEVDPIWLATGKEDPLRTAAENLLTAYGRTPRTFASESSELEEAIALLDRVLHERAS